MKSSIHDVARQAKVSIATVSRVLNDKDRVSPATRLKVLQAIETLAYEPDVIARSMVQKKTMTIGLLVPTLANEFWAAVAEKIQFALRMHHYSLMISSAGEQDAQGTLPLLKSFVDRHMDGIILGHVSMTAPGFDLLSESNIPVLGFELKGRDFSSIAGDHAQGARDAVAHLIERGHRQIAYISGSHAVDTREMGYRQALQEYGLKLNRRLIRRVDYGFEQGYAAALDLIDQKEAFSGLFCWNDMLAIGALNALRDRGIRVPQDVAIVGFDDIAMAGQYKPALTTVRQPISEMSDSVVRMLVSQIREGQKDTTVRTLQFPMRLIVRETSGADSKNMSEGQAEYQKQEVL